MGRAHKGRTGDPQHEPDGDAETRDISERVAAVVLAFHALRDGRPAEDPPPRIAPPPDASDVAQPPAGAPAGPPLPRRLRGSAAIGPLAPPVDGATSWRTGRPGPGASALDGTPAPPGVMSPANGNGVSPGPVSPWPVSPGAVSGGTVSPESSAPERPAERSAVVTSLDAALFHLAALAVAVWAFVAPWLSVLVVAATTTAVVAVGLARDRPDPRTFARRAGRRVVTWLRPRSLVWVPVLMARVVILSVVLPFAVGAGRWLVEHGSEGAMAAGRAAAWHHGFRVAAAGVCFLLVTGSGEAHDRRARALRSRLQPLGTVGIASLTVAALTVVLGLPLVGPRVGGGPSGADGLAWVPPTLRDEVDRVRDAMVRAELHAASVCLSESQGSRWDFTYTSGNALSAPDVATLHTERADPAAADVATLVVGVHNQLAPWVEEIEVVADGTSVARLERQTLPTARPVAHTPVGAAVTGADLLRDGTSGFDRRVALRCSAGAVL